MLSFKTKRNISRIIPFGVIWMILGWIFLYIEKVAMGGWENSPSSAIRVDWTILIFASILVAVFGMVIGAIELLYLNRLFANQSFLKKITAKFFIYALFMSVIMLISYPAAAAFELNTGYFDALVWNKYFSFLKSDTHFSTVLQMSVSLLLSLLYAEISDNIGHGVLINFFTGKYHNPVNEERIFMFLDMKSSTTIAEELGNVLYFKMLREYYADISDAIVRFGGEIYQYVGDEIIISWKLKKGDSFNNSILCFFAMKDDLMKHKALFEKRYGIVPTFKAGIHLGEVTTGEIGVVKKDILFTGDVLNVTARIQSLCNDFNAELIVSSALHEKLDFQNSFSSESIGTHQLRGRSESMELFKINSVSDG